MKSFIWKAIPSDYLISLVLFSPEFQNLKLIQISQIFSGTSKTKTSFQIDV